MSKVEEASAGDNPGDHVVLTHDPLDLAQCVASVASPRAGATSTFIGTTRDHFDGRAVVRLEYQAYVQSGPSVAHCVVRVGLTSYHLHVCRRSAATTGTKLWP